MVHHVLKCRRGITEFKWHNFGFEEPLLCFYCCDPLTSRVYSNVVVPIPNIEFEHKFGLLHLIKYDINPGQGVYIWDSPPIDFPIIIDWLSLATLLFDVEEGAQLRVMSDFASPSPGINPTLGFEYLMDLRLSFT
jgi:hypothetical protein